MIELRSGRDQGAEMRRDRIALAERRAHATRMLRRAIAQAASRSGSGLAHRTAATTVRTLSPFDRGHDRTGAVQRALGFEPLLWADESSAVQRSPVERVRVYLDPSGSMSGVLPALYAALVGCLDLVEPVVWGFSTGIAPLTHAQLRAGVRLSTGGTDIDAVTDHLLDAGVRHALVVRRAHRRAGPPAPAARRCFDGVAGQAQADALASINVLGAVRDPRKAFQFNR